MSVAHLLRHPVARRALVLTLALPVAAPAAFAQLTPEQTLNRYAIADLRFSPDGSHVAFTVTEPVKGAARRVNIWMLDVGARAARRFTTSAKSDTSPRWSPDGRTLAFLSTREEGGAQIYLMPATSGEATRLTKGKQAVQSFEWSPDGKQIAFLARVPKSDEQDKKEKDRDDARVVDDGSERAQVWVADADSGVIRQVTSGAFSARGLQWHPSGTRLIVVAQDPPESEEWDEHIVSVDLVTGARTTLVSPKGPVGQLSVSPDGRHVAWTGARLDGPSPHDIYVAPLDGGQARNLTATSLDRPVGAFAWRADGALVASVARGFSNALTAITLDGATTEIATPLLPGAFAMAKDGRLAFVGQDATRLPEVYLTSGAGAADKVTDFHKDWAAIPLVAPRVFRYKSFDGQGVEAALLMPPNVAAGQRLPLVVLVHGGPTGRWARSFEPWGQMLAARGFAVLYPNIRGSDGYGWAFLEANRADWGGGDFKDVMAGVDAVVAQGVADPNRLGIGGWSYGGYMSAWAITQTTRFKAAVAGAGLSDLASEFGTEAGPAYDEWFYGTPYEKPEGFVKSSPITFIRNARTPTLILQGENDTTDPMGQSQQLYRGLRHYDVPVEFVLYPREPHGLREEKHQVDMMTRLLGWFQKYLMPGGAPAAAK